MRQAYYQYENKHLSMGRLLASLRKIQYLSSSYSTCILVNKPVFCIQFCLFLFGLLSAVVGRFYFWERYHLYGCRLNYTEGFPVLCPDRKRPTFIDLDTATCYGLTFSTLVLMVIIPIVWANFHWKCKLRNEIIHQSNKVFKHHKIVDGDTILKLQSILLSLEHASRFCTLQKCKAGQKGEVGSHGVLVHIGSSLWSEIYFNYHFKRWGSLTVLLLSLSLTIILPGMVPLMEHGWPGIITMLAMVMFYVSPLLCGLLLVILAMCMSSNHPQLGILLLLIGWFLVNMLSIIFAYMREKCDELELLRKNYADDLPLYIREIKSNDVDVLLYLRGYGKKISEL